VTRFRQLVMAQLRSYQAHRNGAELAIAAERAQRRLTGTFMAVARAR